MNERIEGLAKRAGYNGYYATEQFGVAEFAHLIVRECVDVAIDNGCGDFVDIRQKLYEQFGVEE